MDVAPDIAQIVARIYNDAWLVRNYSRGRNSSIGRAERAHAIRKLGLTVRFAFNISDDFEALLTALYDGLTPQKPPPF
jgi:hypothetical protein